MSKLINFVDTNRILNGYINNEYAALEVIKDVVNVLKGENASEVSSNIINLKFFTNRFAYSFTLKNGKIITSKQCENCALVNGKPVKPAIADLVNPYFNIKQGKTHKMKYEDLQRINQQIERKTLDVIIYTDFKDVANAEEYVFDTAKGEYLVFNRSITRNKKENTNPNREGYYIVYADGDQLKMKFGDTRGIDNSLIKYRGYDTFKEADKHYNQFLKDVK